MKKLNFTILLCLLFSFFYAQEYDFSKETKLNSKVPRFKILGRNVNYIVAQRWGAKANYLDLYNAKLKKVSSKEIVLAKDENLKKIWIQAKQGWLIYTKANKEYTLIQARKLDAKFNIKSKPLILDSLVERKDLVQENLRAKYSFNEKFVASYLPVFSAGKMNKFSISIYNTALEKVQKVDLQNKFIKEGKYIRLLVLNDGGFVLVFKDQESTNNFRVYYKAVNADLKIIPLKIENEIFKKLKIEVDNKTKELIFAGFNLFREGKKTNAANAFFSFKLNLETGVKSNKVTEIFTKAFYQLLTGKESKKDNISLQTFYFKSIIPKQDGGYLVFAESFYENVETKSIPYRSGSVNSGPSVFSENTYKTKYFNYNDVIVYTISNNMALESVNIINKRQQSLDDKGGYSSFFIVNQQDKLNVLFLDEINTNATLKNYEINAHSTIYRDYILNSAQNNVMPVVKMSVQTGPNEILIPSFLNNSFSIIKVIFN